MGCFLFSFFPVILVVARLLISATIRSFPRTTEFHYAGWPAGNSTDAWKHQRRRTLRCRFDSSRFDVLEIQFETRNRICKYYLIIFYRSIYLKENGMKSGNTSAATHATVQQYDEVELVSFLHSFSSVLFCVNLIFFIDQLINGNKILCLSFCKGNRCVLKTREIVKMTLVSVIITRNVFFSNLMSAGIEG